MIVEDQNQLIDANVRIEHLQDSIESLNSEVKKLSRALSLSMSGCQMLSETYCFCTWETFKVGEADGWNIWNHETHLSKNILYIIILYYTVILYIDCCMPCSGQGLDLNQECLGFFLVSERKKRGPTVTVECRCVVHVDIVWRCEMLEEPQAHPRYWKGFSRGLKETRKTVADSDEGLPSVQLDLRTPWWL